MNIVKIIIRRENKDVVVLISHIVNTANQWVAEKCNLNNIKYNIKLL